MVTAIALVIGVALVVLLPFSVRVVREYRRIVVFRLGRCVGQRGPGVVLLVPGVDRWTWVDLREFFLEIPKQDCITKDNAPISIDFITFYQVLDPVASVVQVGNFQGAAQNIAATTLRAVTGDILLDDVLAKRDDINRILAAKLDEITERWGVKVTNVEIREITPPPGVQDAMTRQMSAERSRRAAVTEAEGSRQAAILQAEGRKQAAILEAEGTRQAAILHAEGERQAAILVAEGFAAALDAIDRSASAVAPNTMGIQYLDALKALGRSPSTKFVLPLELTSLLGGLGALATGAFAGDAASHTVRRE
jgi:regulator of protease activity HflC (stomatin/prohibitin superfamily)